MLSPLPSSAATATPASTSSSTTTATAKAANHDDDAAIVDDVFAFSPIATAILSPSYHIQRVSHSFLQAWQLRAADECVGRDILSLIRERKLWGTGEEEVAHLQQALRTAVDTRAVQTVARRDHADDPPSSSAAAAGLAQTPSIRIVPVFRADSLLALVFEWLFKVQPVFSPPSHKPLYEHRTSGSATTLTYRARPDQTTTHDDDDERGPTSSSSSSNHSDRTQIAGSQPSPAPETKLIGSLSLDDPFRTLIQSVKDYAIFLLDVHGRISTWNAGAELHKGYSSAEIIGKHFSIFYSPDDVAAGKPQRELDDCLRDGNVEDEGWRYRKDGSRFWANVTITALYKNGVHVGYGKVTRDMTERRAAELRLIAAYEESAKLKSDFLANVSHEIRTPMHGMLSACSLLLDTPLTPAQHEVATIIDESGHVLLRVLNDILDYSKLASGNFSIHTDVVGIASIVASVVRSAQPTLPPSVRLQLVLASDLPRAVQGDPLRFRQVMQNLVGNAIKFTDRGHIRVSTFVRHQDEDTYLILTKVTDTGIGIPPDAVPALFAPFTQVDNTTKKRFQGTGLGLSICKSLAELMGGEIGYEPNPDRQGSVFWFTAQFRKIKSLTQLKSDADVTAEHIQRRQSLSPVGGSSRPRPWNAPPAEERQQPERATLPTTTATAPALAPAPAPAPAAEPTSPLATADVAVPLDRDATIGTTTDKNEVESSPEFTVKFMSSPLSTPATTPSSELGPLSPSKDIKLLAGLMPAGYESLAALAHPPLVTAMKDGGTQTADDIDRPADCFFMTRQSEPAPAPAPAPTPANVTTATTTKTTTTTTTITGADTCSDSADSPPHNNEHAGSSGDQQKQQQSSEQAARAADAAIQEEALRRLRARAAGKRLLVVEDNVINQRVMLGMLRSFGFDPALVALASDGAQAASQVEVAAAAAAEGGGMFDLVLMDINMPVVDGHEATVQIRRAGHSVPIVAMTAYALQGDREQCLACGMDDYVAKPVKKALLVEKLLAWLPE
ncbi:ATPase-like, ATP-binding domain protein [Niveomyces insectorum RCEF 264]|uniref:ATPase-like, ATP-binding domain protein n=1 Tax=Niveomyces insectorum RCEF 264 TaxID=1081102 RepID=A0A167XZC5_9HYPO|nr:ATPase-like, ATP-binding domain protein [Niveomyces insectorum RCEF 264]